jgi:hypothetical protein
LPANDGVRSAVRPVDAANPGAHRRHQAAARLGIGSQDPIQRLADGTGDVDPCPLGLIGERPWAAGQAGGALELSYQRRPLGLQLVCGGGVTAGGSPVQRSL